MANTSSAKKRLRRDHRQTRVNRDRRSSVRSFLKKVENAITKGDAAAAGEAFRQAQPAMMRGVGKGIFKRNTAARKLSRLSARIKALNS